MVFVLGHAVNGGGRPWAGRRSGRRRGGSLRLSQRSFPLREGRFEVDLGELGLAVGAQILVAEAAGDLEVALEAGDHQDLLEDLRRLRQRVETAGMNAAGDQVVARAFGRGAGHERASRSPGSLPSEGSRGSRWATSWRRREVGLHSRRGAGRDSGTSAAPPRWRWRLRRARRAGSLASLRTSSSRRRSRSRRWACWGFRARRRAADCAFDGDHVLGAQRLGLAVGFGRALCRRRPG